MRHLVVSIFAAYILVVAGVVSAQFPGFSEPLPSGIGSSVESGSSKCQIDESTQGLIKGVLQTIKEEVAMSSLHIFSEKLERILEQQVAYSTIRCALSTLKHEVTVMHNDHVIDDVRFQGNNLTSNRGGSMKKNMLQVTVFYDGADTASLDLEVTGTTGVDSISIDTIPNFSKGIQTYEFLLSPEEVPTGCFTIANVAKNGVVDGVGFGLFYKDALGGYHHLQSSDMEKSQLAYVGTWPLGLWDARFTKLTPQLLTDYAREQARFMLYGAELLDNGEYCFELFYDSE